MALMFDLWRTSARAVHIQSNLVPRVSLSPLPKEQEIQNMGCSHCAEYGAFESALQKQQSPAVAKLERILKS